MSNSACCTHFIVISEHLIKKDIVRLKKNFLLVQVICFDWYSPKLLAIETEEIKTNKISPEAK